MVGLDGTSQCVVLLHGRHRPTGPQLRAAVERPALHVGPGQFPHVVVGEPAPGPVDTEHRPAACDTHAHGRACGGVHTRCEAPRMDDRHPPGGGALVDVGELRGGREDLVDLDHGGEGGAAGRLCGGVVARGDEVLDGARVVHGLHQGDARHAVVTHTEDAGFGGGVRGEDLLHGGVAQQCRHPPVVGRGGTPALDVAEDRDARVLVESFLEDPGDPLGSHAFPRLVRGPLRHQQDGVAASRGAPGLELLAHVVLPAGPHGVLRGEHVVGAAGDRPHEGQVPAVATHDLDDEGALVGRGRRGELVDGVDDAVQGRVGADRHVRADQVVVDGADEADDDERRVGVGGGLVDGALGDEFTDVLGPLGTELLGARQ